MDARLLQIVTDVAPLLGVIGGILALVWVVNRHPWLRRQSSGSAALWWSRPVLAVVLGLVAGLLAPGALPYRLEELASEATAEGAAYRVVFGLCEGGLAMLAWTIGAKPLLRRLGIIPPKPDAAAIDRLAAALEAPEQGEAP